jgi:peptidoglycan/LPS O-acetylase OafA/YrhL
VLALEGMRACAALGVVATHVALQTGLTHGLTGGLLIRLDLAVAVFFALSGFLLWRSHAGAAHGFRSVPRAAPYLRSRLVRIMPAYLVTVVVVLTLLPDARTAGRSVWIANLTLTQVYVPRTLYAGLSQMWSLSVEMSFYLALPLLAVAAARLPVRARVPAIAAVALASFGWGYLPIPTSNGANPLNWAPAYAAWFAVGMLLAEWTCRPMSWLHRLARRRVLMTSIALAAYLVAASPLVVPPAYRYATVDQFIIRTVLGVIIAGCLLAPLILDRPQARHRMLGSTPMAALGRWSYGLFLWHLAALDTALAMLNRPASTGGFPVVFVVTVVFGSAIAAVSYALIEEPCRLALRRWEIRRQMDGGSSAPPATVECAG